VAAAVATQVSTTWNFAGTEMFVFPGAKPGRIYRRYVGFSVLNNTVMLARLPLLALLVSGAHLPKVPSNVATLLIVFVVRFGISDRFIYDRTKKAEETRNMTDVRPGPEVPVATKSGPVDIDVQSAVETGGGTVSSPAAMFRYLYDLHGIVRIGSDVALPELAYFLQPAGGSALPDITVRIGRVGRMRARTRLVRSADSRAIRWEEHLGRAAANFAVDFQPQQISVTTSRTLARSPHVLYTNVVEALLRFVFVERGYMLLHAACMEIDGRGVMLSARTDTGKTGTVLKLLRTSGGRFLADDMTIIDSRGTARSFPKPLTISQHTLRAVHAGDLSRSEWAKLRVQSRLHSKEGRGFAMKLAEHNVPIMTINSWVQRIVPPPKYHVQRLVPCELGSTATVDELYIIERGVPHHSMVPQAQAIGELLENTEDAYGFPPYRYVAPALCVGGLSYDELRERERLILISAMESVTIHRLGSADFSWADDIAAAEERSSTDRGGLQGASLGTASIELEAGVLPEVEPPLTGSDT
jgi:dolichol-phosphate mannosyltransferase